MRWSTQAVEEPPSSGPSAAWAGAPVHGHGGPDDWPSPTGGVRAPRDGHIRGVPDRLTIEQDEPVLGVTELRVHGEVDLGGGKHLQRALEAVVAGGGRVVVDLCGCTFLDSSGLSALIRTSRSAPEPGRFAVYCLPEGTVRQVFSLTRAHTVLDVHVDRASAIAAVAP